MRAMFLEFPNDYTHGSDTRYQYMYGPSFLVAPIYPSTRPDSLGNDIRNGIYLPQRRCIRGRPTYQQLRCAALEATSFRSSRSHSADGETIEQSFAN